MQNNLDAARHCIYNYYLLKAVKTQNIINVLKAYELLHVYDTLGML